MKTTPPEDEPGLPWPSRAPPTAPPSFARPASDAWLCSATKRLLTEDTSSAVLSDIFGWRAPVSASTRGAQLVALGEAHPTVRDPAVGRALASAVPRVYALLTASVGSAEFEAAAATARDAAAVWVGVGFARADAVAVSGALDLAPYLHVLPADLTCFRPLLASMGVRDAFGAREYAGLMRRLAKDAGPRPLDPSRLDLALWVLGTLADHPPASWRGSESESESTRECEPALPAPDADGALAPATALRYNDAPWLAAPDGVRLAHPKLPPATAEAIGIRSLRLALLSESSEELGMQLHDSAEAFGQHEALTTRLKHILDAYADGPGVISELVQNADDAGATEVRLSSIRTRAGRNLLGPRLAEWQGPALVAWNDAVFSLGFSQHRAHRTG